MRYFTKTPHCRGVDNAGAVGENCSYGWRSAYSELAVKQGQSFSRHTCNGRDGDMQTLPDAGILLVYLLVLADDGNIAQSSS